MPSFKQVRRNAEEMKYSRAVASDGRYSARLSCDFDEVPTGRCLQLCRLAKVRFYTPDVTYVNTPAMVQSNFYKFSIFSIQELTLFLDDFNR